MVDRPAAAGKPAVRIARANGRKAFIIAGTIGNLRPQSPSSPPTEAQPRPELVRFDPGAGPRAINRIGHSLRSGIAHALDLGPAILNHMQKWQYKVFASHLDPAELVVILDEAGEEGWELLALVAVLDYHLPEIADVIGASEDASMDEAEAEAVPVEAFRYIFKRPLA
jgi:hypothetical protein